jgi:dTDP-4-dehydrorhamnose reductase
MIALIGASGQLGTDFKKILETNQVVDLNYPEFDLTKIKTIEKSLLQQKPDMVINTAAYNLVDRAEDHPEEALAVNHSGVENLARVCAKFNLPLVHFSSDYVFGADTARKTPYTEEDNPDPINSYGLSKLKGERSVQKILSAYYLIRTSYLFGTAGSLGKGGNIVESLIEKGRKDKRLEVVDDQVISPTYTLDLARQVLKIIMTNKYGLYHVSSVDNCSIYEFASYIFECLNEQIDIVPIKSKDLSLPAKRPHYSVLENDKLDKLGLNIMRGWHESLKDYLVEKKYL